MTNHLKKLSSLSLSGNSLDGNYNLHYKYPSSVRAKPLLPLNKENEIPKVSLDRLEVKEIEIKTPFKLKNLTKN